MSGFRPIFGRFRTRRIFYWLQNSQNPQLKIAKIMIFWNILKIDLKRFWYRFRVQNNSRTPQVCISDHISCTQPLQAELSKIDFLAKIVILAILKPVEYFKGPKSAEYWPEPIHIPHGSFQIKWQQIGRHIFGMALKYVFWPHFPKICTFYI